jgi:biotin carboxyl carrier protein
MAIVKLERDGKQFTVYVAGSEGDIWAFHDGHIYREREQASPPSAPKGGHHHPGTQPAAQLAAPMPATVVKILVQPGQQVHRGDTLVVLEAMKMELPVRAPGDATVKAVNCREGELVQPDRALVELA